MSRLFLLLANNPHLASSDDFLPDLEILERKAISHSLEGFSFSSDTWALDEAALFREDTPLVQNDGGNEADGYESGLGGDFIETSHGAVPEEDFFMGDQAVGDDFGGDDLGPGEYVGEDGENGSADAQAGLGPAGSDGGRHIAFDPRRAPNERALIMAMTDADGEGGMLDYFDQSALKNWAGPEHWKLRKTIRRRSSLHLSLGLPLMSLGVFFFVQPTPLKLPLPPNLGGRRKRPSRLTFYPRWRRN